jgi:hypothetical protein
MTLTRRQFVTGAAGAGLILLTNPLPKILPAWRSSLAFGAGIKYVSNRTTTGGNGTLGNPYRVDEVWANLTPGDEFIYLNGLYQGANSMLDVNLGGGEGKAGTAQAWVTLRAETDGQVTFDGQFARIPMRFADNHYFIVEGFNACNSNAGVISVTQFSSGTNIPCSWMQLKRLCAWDASVTTNVHCFFVGYGTNFLIEDCASWGGGRKMLEIFSGGTGTSGGYGGGGTTIRRHWASWGKFGGGAFGPRHTYSISYNYTNVLAENIIGTWDSEAGAVVTNISDIIGHDGSVDGDLRYVKLYGSLAYLRQAQVCPVGYMTLFPGQIGHVDIRDCYSCIENGVNHTTRRPFWTGTPTTGVNTVNGLTTIHNGTLSQFASGWTYSNISEAGPRALPAIPKYENGVLTGTPLLPWPMNQRIIDGRIQSGRSAVDVTAMVQLVLGNVADTTPPTTPTGLVVT